MCLSWACAHTTVRAQLARCLEQAEPATEQARGSWGGQEGTGVHSGKRVGRPPCRGPAHPLLLSREYRRLRDLLWLGHWPCSVFMHLWSLLGLWGLFRCHVLGAHHRGRGAGTEPGSPWPGVLLPQELRA